MQFQNSAPGKEQWRKIMGTHDFFSRNRNATNRKRAKIDTFLIVCEGESTEPNYFRKFPIKTNVINMDIRGEGKNTESLVREAIRLKKVAEKEGHPYVQVWVVFDRDSFPQNHFNNALKLCDDNDIYYAVTNEAFELWYLLHFGYYDSAMSRTQYGEKLSVKLESKYDKNRTDMYEVLLER